MNPIISIVIPVYNVEPYIRQCLDSVLNQTYRNLEIIVIDDGSPDHSGEICDEYASKDSRMTVIHKQNGGLCAARNDGISRATGDWIAFVDSDDWCELDYYEKMLELGSKDDPDMIFSQGRLIEYSQKQVFQSWFLDPFHYTEREQIESLMANIPFFGMPWDKLYRADFLHKNHLQFDVSCRALEDYLFNYQAIDHAANIVGCICVGYHNRVSTTTSITRGYNPNKPQIAYHTLLCMHDYAQQRNVTGEAAKGIEKAAMVAISDSLNCCFFHPANSDSYAQIADKIKEMKKESIIYEAVYSKDNHYLSRKQVVLKYAMRLPWAWPIKLLYSAKKLLLLH